MQNSVGIRKFMKSTLTIENLLKRDIKEDSKEALIYFDDNNTVKPIDCNYCCEVWILEDNNFNVKACVGLKCYVQSVGNSKEQDNRMHHPWNNWNIFTSKLEGETNSKLTLCYVGEVCRLFVDESLQRHGIASKLLDFVERRSYKKAKIKHLDLMKEWEEKTREDQMAQTLPNFVDISTFSTLNFNLVHAMVAVTVDTLLPALKLYTEKAGYICIDGGIAESEETRYAHKNSDIEEKNLKKLNAKCENAKVINPSTRTNRIFKGDGKLVVLGKILPFTEN